MDSRDDFRDFVATRSPALLRTARLLTGDWQLAEDLLQTVLAKTYLAWPRIQRRDAPEVYVRRALVTTYATWWRRRWRGETPTDVLPDVAGRDDFAGVEHRSALDAALAALPRRQRAVVVLRYYEDMTESEVARVLGCSVGNVKSQASRALAKLRAHEALAGATHDALASAAPAPAPARTKEG